MRMQFVLASVEEGSYNNVQKQESLDNSNSCHKNFVQFSAIFNVFSKSLISFSPPPQDCQQL